MRRWLGAVAALMLASGCAPQPAHPPLWQVEAPDGGKAWLFGTIHALERPVDWRSGKVDTALDQSRSLVVELIGEGDEARDPARIFAELSRSPGLPPLEERVMPSLRPRLEALLSKAGTDAGQFADVETWAAALTLARLGDDAPDSALGVDKALRDHWVRLGWERQNRAPGTTRELEGVRGQLSIFDSLPESEQRDLLNAVLREHGKDDDMLEKAWRDGDMAAIERQTTRGMLADPELRKALLTDRNRAWAAEVERQIAAGSAPFVAVGAAHLAGPDGLPALLAARGLKVTRVQ